jgi:hypothetical protein
MTKIKLYYSQRTPKLLSKEIFCLAYDSALEFFKLKKSFVRLKQTNFVLEVLRLNQQWVQFGVASSSLFVNP